MTISVEFAALLAQVVPVFLLMIMFERFVFAAVRPEARFRRARYANLLRFVASTLCLLVFLAALAIVLVGEPLTGWLAYVVLAVIALLLGLLWATIQTTYEERRDLIAQQERHATRDRAHADDQDDPDK